MFFLLAPKRPLNHDKKDCPAVLSAHPVGSSIIWLHLAGCSGSRACSEGPVFSYAREIQS